MTDTLFDPDDGLILIGYDHASLIDSMRPDLAYPGRKIRAGTDCVTRITATPCECGDEKGHVEVFVKRIQNRTEEVPA